MPKGLSHKCLEKVLVISPDGKSALTALINESFITPLPSSPSQGPSGCLSLVTQRKHFTLKTISNNSFPKCGSTFHSPLRYQLTPTTSSSSNWLHVGTPQPTDNNPTYSLQHPYHTALPISTHTTPILTTLLGTSHFNLFLLLFTFLNLPIKSAPPLKYFQKILPLPTSAVFCCLFYIYIYQIGSPVYPKLFSLITVEAKSLLR